MPLERYGGNHVVYLSNYVAPDHPVLRMGADEVFDSYLAGLRRINPAFDPSWVKEKWLFKNAMVGFMLGVVVMTGIALVSHAQSTSSSGSLSSN